MKKLTLFFFIIMGIFELKAQTTYFPNKADAWVDGNGNVRARLYSVEINSRHTIVTIELVPTKNKRWLNCWTSRNTIVQAANGKIELPILGFIYTWNGDDYSYKTDFSGNLGWKNVKKGKSYKYSMVFNGIIPPGVTTFNLLDRGAYGGASGYQFFNYSINNPNRESTKYTTEALIKGLINKASGDSFVGIYEGFGGNRYQLACVKENGYYYLLYMSDKEKMSWWNVGDIKAILRESATPGFFKAEWLMADKTHNDNAYVMFEGGSMKVVVDNNEDGYLKMYSGQSQATTNNEYCENWSGTGFALLDGCIATCYHVVENAKSISVQGIRGDFSIAFNAEIIATDKPNDLAIIKIVDNRFNGFGKIPYAIKTNIADVGEEIHVLGYPMTYTMGDEIKLTTGVISSRTGFQGDVALYQISAPIQPGNSGGPLFDSQGDVIGVINAKHQGAENVGYAIKTLYLRCLIESTNSASNIPSSNALNALPLTDKVRSEKKFVFMISCSNQSKGEAIVNHSTTHTETSAHYANNPNVASYNPMLAQTYYNQAIAAWQADDFAAAVIFFRKSIENGNVRLETFEYAVAVANNAKDEEAMLEFATKGNELYGKEDPSFINNIINVYIMKEDYDTALQKLDAAAVTDPDNAQYLALKGLIYTKKRDNAKAEDLYRKALAIDADNSLANLYLGATILEKAGQIQDNFNDRSGGNFAKYKSENVDPLLRESVDYLEKAYKLDENNRSVCLTFLEQAYYILGDQAGMNSVKERKDAE